MKCFWPVCHIIVYEERFWADAVDDLLSPELFKQAAEGLSMKQEKNTYNHSSAFAACFYGAVGK